MESYQPIDVDDGQLRCPSCFNKDIVPSLERGVIDRIMRRWGRIPKQCRFCGKRFYITLERAERK